MKCAFTSLSWYNCVVFYIIKEINILYTDAMFCRIVPRFGRQYRPVCLRLGKRMSTKRDVPIQTPWRERRHSHWDDVLPDFFRGFPGGGPFRRRGPFGDMEAGFEDMMRRMMTPRFFDHYYVRPRHCAETAARSEVEQVFIYIYIHIFFSIFWSLSRWTSRSVSPRVLCNVQRKGLALITSRTPHMCVIFAIEIT